MIVWKGTDNPAPSHATLQTRDQSNPVSLSIQLRTAKGEWMMMMMMMMMMMRDCDWLEGHG